MIKIKSVTIEGMHNVEKKTYNFNDVNYLYGRNGAGKSTVLQAVQLALLGYIPGMNKTKENIFSNANNHTMAVTLELSDGSKPIQVQRIWNSAGKSINSIVNTSPDGYKVEDIVKDLELPIFNFNDFVGMTANKLKDWFIGFLPGSEKAINWDDELTESTKAINIVDETLIPHTMAAVGDNDLKGVDQVRFANNYFKQEISYKKKELDRIQSTIQSLVFYDDCDTDVTVDELTAEKNELRNKIDESIRNQSIAARNEVIYSKLSELNLTANNAEEDNDYIDAMNKSEAIALKCKELDNDAQDTQSKIDEIKQLRSNLVAENSTMLSVVRTNGACSYTGEICQSIVPMIEDMSKKVEDNESKISEYAAQIISYQDKLDAISKERNALGKDFTELRMAARNIVQKYAEKESLTKSIQNIEGEVMSGEALEELQNRLNAISDTIIKVSANNKYNELIDTLSKDKFSIEQTIEALKLWDKLTSANGLQTKLMNEPFINFADRIDKYVKPLFGDSVSTKFNLIEKANSFSFGIERDNKYIPYDLLSSGEKCMFMLAMMICIVSESNSELKLIMIDDLFDHLDDDNVNKLFDSLSNVSEVQFIVAGVKKIASDKNAIEVK